MIFNNRRIKAFTIIEMLITMMISAVVVSITFFAYENISYNYNKYQANRDMLFDLELIYSNLYSHFQDSKTIKIKENTLIFEREANIEYQFGGSFIINSILPNDTLFINIEEVSTSYNSQFKNEGIIDELNIKVLMHKDTISLNFYKEYPIGMKLFFESLPQY